MTLSNDQRDQLRKDVIDLRQAAVEAEQSCLVPKAVKKLIALQSRIIDTMAIHAGAYEKMSMKEYP